MRLNRGSNRNEHSITIFMRRRHRVRIELSFTGVGEIADGTFQRFRDAINDSDSRVSNAAFDAADIGPMETALISEFLL